MATAQFKSPISPYQASPTSPDATQLPTFPAVPVALIGLGRIGVMYLRKIMSLPTLHLTHVVLSPRQSPEEIRARYGIPESVCVTVEVADCLGDDIVEGVVIATSTDSHVHLITQSLRAGKAVFCEKPVSRDMDQTKECYTLADELKLPLFCAFNRRFDPSYATIQRQVRAGQVGLVHSIRSVSRDSPLIPLSYIGPSGGVFDDFAVHDIDLQCWVVGDVPSEVYVTGTAHIPEFAAHGDLDSVLIVMKWRSGGGVGTIELDRYCSYGYDQRLEVFGPGGMVQCGHHRPNTLTIHDTMGSRTPPLHYSFPSHYDAAFTRQLEHFAGVVRGVRVVGVTGKETLAVAKVVTACKESVRTGAPVRIEWREEEIPE
eukprot:sb/3465801/